jgi:hypothetical protein
MTALKLQLRQIIDAHGLLETIRMCSIIANDMGNPKIFHALDSAYGKLTAHGPSRIHGPKKCGAIIPGSYGNTLCSRTRANGCGFFRCPNLDPAGNPLPIDR